MRHDKPPVRAGSLAGYRSKHFAPGAPSMLGSLASGIASSLPPPERVAPAGAEEWRNKKEIMDSANYRPDNVIVGFSGTFRR